MDFFDPTTPPDGGGELPPPEPAPADLDGDGQAGPIDSAALIRWVHDTIIPLLQRPLERTTWCPLWYEHTEAMLRFELIYRSWQQAVVSDDGDAMSSWVLGHLDPHLRELTSPNGPFAECEYTARHGFSRFGNTPHQPHAPLPVVEPPGLSPG